MASPGPSTVGIRQLRHHMGQRMRAALNVHRPGGEPDVLLFSTPRGGSTWLFELIGTQPGFKSCDEPLNLRNSNVSRTLGIDDWRDLYHESREPSICLYFQRLHEGKLSHMNRNLWEANHRAFTHRMVYKVLHGAEYMAPVLAESVGARVVVLLRHPIPVALSRGALPRLDAILQSSASEQYDVDVVREMARITAKGTPLERGVLSWCLQTAPLLNAARRDWALVTYEQLVVDASPVIQHLAEVLALPDPDTMLARVNRASASIRGMSTPATHEALSQPASQNRSLWLVEKWREKVTVEEERAAMTVLEIFDIDAYQFDSVFPNDSLWIDLRTHSKHRGDDDATAPA
jgi:hypothetical protein